MRESIVRAINAYFLHKVQKNEQANTILQTAKTIIRKPFKQGDSSRCLHFTKFGSILVLAMELPVKSRGHCIHWNYT